MKPDALIRCHDHLDDHINSGFRKKLKTPYSQLSKTGTKKGGTELGGENAGSPDEH